MKVLENKVIGFKNSKKIVSAVDEKLQEYVSSIRNAELTSLSKQIEVKFSINIVYEIVTSLYLTNSQTLANNLLEKVETFNKETQQLARENDFQFYELPDFIVGFSVQDYFTESKALAFEREGGVDKFDTLANKLIAAISELVVDEYKRLKDFMYLGKFEYITKYVNEKYLNVGVRTGFEGQVVKFASKVLDHHSSYLTHLSP
jgi:hypothetical protein